MIQKNVDVPMKRVMAAVIAPPRSQKGYSYAVVASCGEFRSVSGF
ncbi:hypothetical protein [Methanoculleus sp.]|nr:hypothetical protein [Methanoculleus sp.]